MAGRRATYLLILAGCLTFYFAYRQWASWFFLMAAVWLPVFSLAMSLPAMLTTRLRLDMPETVNLGQIRELTVDCSGKLPAPPWRCRIAVRRPMTGERWMLREHDTLPTEHCGVLNVAPERCRVFDYLCLFKLPAQHDPACRIVVRPVPVPIKGLRAPDLSLEQSWKPKPGGGFSENHELRLYRPGDSIHQIHWKLSAKTGKLILREPMEPIRGRVLVRLDLKGTPDELDRKLGQLLWLGRLLIEKNLSFQLRCLTDKGVLTRQIAGEFALRQAIDELLLSPRALSGTLQVIPENAAWQYFIGGDCDEA